MSYKKGCSLRRTLRRIERKRKNVLNNFIFVMMLLSEITVTLVELTAKILIFIFKPIVRYINNDRVHKEDVVKPINIKNNVIELKSYYEKKKRNAI